MERGDPQQTNSPPPSQHYIPSRLNPQAQEFYPYTSAAEVGGIPTPYFVPYIHNPVVQYPVTNAPPIFPFDSNFQLPMHPFAAVAQMPIMNAPGVTSYLPMPSVLNNPPQYPTMNQPPASFLQNPGQVPAQSPQPPLAQYVPPRPASETQPASPSPATVVQPVTRKREATGWPIGHPPIPSLRYYGLHPFKIPDEIFLRERKNNAWLAIHDPYEGGIFDASKTPWWTHWTLAVAHHAIHSIPPSALHGMYKHRYRDVIPNIHRMTPTDEMELWLFIEANEDRYAFDWEQELEPEMRNQVWGYVYKAWEAEEEIQRGTRGRRAGGSRGASGSSKS